MRKARLGKGWKDLSLASTPATAPRAARMPPEAPFELLAVFAHRGQTGIRISDARHEVGAAAGLFY
jgi:hypothetical protein